MIDPIYRAELGDNPGRRIAHEHGFIEYRYGPSRTCEIVNIEVDSNHRQQGVGRRLLEMLFKEINGKADHVYAITRSDNEIAQEFYEKTKFRVSGTLRRFYADEHGVDAVCYARSRSGPV